MTTQTIAHRAAQLLSLEGRVAVVTGAGSGIGRGISARLSEMGARVAVLDIDERQGVETARQIQEHGGEAVSVICDVRSAVDCRRAVKTAMGKWGQIDILCNCAGIAIRKDVVDLSEDEWDRALE